MIISIYYNHIDTFYQYDIHNRTKRVIYLFVLCSGRGLSFLFRFFGQKNIFSRLAMCDQLTK